MSSSLSPCEPSSQRSLVSLLSEAALTYSRTLQKLAHRRQSEKHHLQKHDESDGTDGTDGEDEADEQQEHAANGQPSRPESEREASLVPVVVVQPGKDGLSGRTLSELSLDSPKLVALEVPVDRLRPRGTNPAQRRKSPGRDEERHQGEGDEQVGEGQYLRSKLWWLGQLLITVGEGGNFVSYGFAPASVVAPLGTVVSLLAPKE